MPQLRGHFLRGWHTIRCSFKDGMFGTLCQHGVPAPLARLKQLPRSRLRRFALLSPNTIPQSWHVSRRIPSAATIMGGWTTSGTATEGDRKPRKMGVGIGPQDSSASPPAPVPCENRAHPYNAISACCTFPVAAPAPRVSVPKAEQPLQGGGKRLSASTQSRRCRFPKVLTIL